MINSLSDIETFMSIVGQCDSYVVPCLMLAQACPYKAVSSNSRLKREYTPPGNLPISELFINTVLCSLNCIFQPGCMFCEQMCVSVFVLQGASISNKQRASICLLPFVYLQKTRIKKCISMHYLLFVYLQKHVLQNDKLVYQMYIL